jgi:hypothetical protein
MNCHELPSNSNSKSWFGRLAPSGSRPERGAGENFALLSAGAFENKIDRPWQFYLHTTLKM